MYACTCARTANMHTKTITKKIFKICLSVYRRKEKVLSIKAYECGTPCRVGTRCWRLLRAYDVWKQLPVSRSIVYACIKQLTHMLADGRVPDAHRHEPLHSIIRELWNHRHRLDRGPGRARYGTPWSDNHRRPNPPQKMRTGVGKRHTVRVDIAVTRMWRTARAFVVSFTARVLNCFCVCAVNSVPAVVTFVLWPLWLLCCDSCDFCAVTALLWPVWLLCCDQCDCFTVTSVTALLWPVWLLCYDQCDCFTVTSVTALLWPVWLLYCVYHARDCACNHVLGSCDDIRVIWPVAIVLCIRIEGNLSP